MNKPCVPVARIIGWNVVYGCRIVSLSCLPRVLGRNQIAPCNKKRDSCRGNYRLSHGTHWPGG